MLTGQYAHNLDAKGRVNFPARLREELGDRVVVTRGRDNCLFVYSMEDWERLAAKLRVSCFRRICANMRGLNAM